MIEAEAKRLGIPLTTLEDHQVIDFTFDGADEVDPALNLIKGGGGALREKLVASQAAMRSSSWTSPSSRPLGNHWAVPVEVIPFGWRTQYAYLESLGRGPPCVWARTALPLSRTRAITSWTALSVLLQTHLAWVPAWTPRQASCATDCSWGWRTK